MINLKDLQYKYENDKKYKSYYNKTIVRKGVKKTVRVELTDYIALYNDFVNDNNINISKNMRLQMKRVEKMLNNPNYYYDLKLANKPIKFIEKYCKHVKGKLQGKPLLLSEWEKYYIAVSHGIVYKDTGLRVTRELSVVIARKNNKTTALAALALYHAIADGEKGPEVYNLANTKQQANALYNTAFNMIRMNNKLQKLVHKRKTDIEIKKNLGIMMPLASDSSTLDGLNTSAAILDELHEYKDSNLIDVIQSSIGARDQPILIFITTNGTLRDRVFDNRYNYWTNILNGLIVDDTVQPFIYELDDMKEINDEEMWVKANPNLFRSTSISYLKSQLKKALDDHTQQSGVFTKHFNLPMNSSTAFFTKEECNFKGFEKDELIGSSGFCGLDMSYTKDLACLTYCSPTEINEITGEKEYRFKQLYFKAEGQLEETSKTDKIDYQKYVDSGELMLCPGNVLTQPFVLQQIEKFVGENQLTVYQFAIDSYRAEWIIKELQDRYYEKYAIHTNIKLKKAITRTIYQTKSLLKEGKFLSNSELLKLHFAAIEATIDKNDELVISKMKSNTRIDGAVSVFYSLKAEELYNYYN